MMKRNVVSTVSVPEEIALLGERIELWRRRRGKMCPMPEELWIEAAELGRRFGISTLSKKLRLDFRCLKRRVEEEHAVAVSTHDGFVDLGLFDGFCKKKPVESSVTEMEICKGGEVTVRIRHSGSLELDIADIVGRCLGKS